MTHTSIHTYVRSSIIPYIHPSIHTYILADKQTDRETCGHTNRQTSQEAGRQGGRQGGRRAAGRQTDGRTHRHICECKLALVYIERSRFGRPRNRDSTQTLQARIPHSIARFHGPFRKISRLPELSLESWLCANTPTVLSRFMN